MPKFTDPLLPPTERLTALRRHGSIQDDVTSVQAVVATELIDILEQHIAIVDQRLKALEKAAGVGVGTQTTTNAKGG